MFSIVQQFLNSVEGDSFATATGVFSLMPLKDVASSLLSLLLLPILLDFSLEEVTVSI